MSMEDSLSGNLIESILEACSNEASISEMINAGTSYHTIKKWSQMALGTRTL